MNETDTYEIDRNIENGFEMLKDMNYLLYKRTKQNLFWLQPFAQNNINFQTTNF